MTLLSDEMIEKAAEAHWNSVDDDRIPWSQLKRYEPAIYEQALSQTRAALTAILPDIGESFAKVADRHEQGLIASAIRALAKGE